jgi:oligosaccharide repeat unit polymerase
MMIALYTLIHAAFLVLIGAIWLHDSGKRMVVTPFIFFALVEIVFSWNYWLLFQKLDVQVTPWAMIVSMSATACFLMGYVFLSTYDEIRQRGGGTACRLKRYLERPFVRQPAATQSIVLIGLMVLGTAMGVAYHEKTPPAIEGAVAFVQKGNLQAAQSIVSTGRKEETKSHVFGGEYHGQGIFKSFMVVAWAYGLTLSLLLAIAEKKWRWRFFSLLFFAGSYYFVAGTGERANFIWGLAVAVTGLSFLIRMSLRKTIAAGFVVVFFMGALTFLLPRYQVKDTRHGLIVKIFSSVADRILMGNKINNVRLMNFMDKGRFEHTYGSENLDLLLNVLPGIQRPPLGYRLGVALGNKGTTYYNGTYQGTVYIDFGIAGIVVVYFALGAFVAAAFLWLLRLPKRPENIAFMSLVIFKLGHMSISAGPISFLSAMVPVVAIHLVALCCAFLLRPLSCALGMESLKSSLHMAHARSERGTA